MNWSVVRLDDVQPSRWKNGGGQTRELLAWPSAEAWQLRVSIADIDRDGPFSPFADVQRWFAVLEGHGVRLTVNTHVSELRRDSPPFEFDGGAVTECRLIDGATRDFNFMARGTRARLRRLSGTVQIPKTMVAWVGVYAHEHEVALEQKGRPLTLSARCLAWQIVAGAGNSGVDEGSATAQSQTVDGTANISVEGRDFLLLERYS